MARPLKEGIDYFPFDVGFVEDKKVKLIKAEFGAKGVLVLLQVLCTIYKENGYFCTLDEDDCLFMADAVGCGVDSLFIRQVVHGCIRRSLFDDTLFNMFGVLTSRGIQRRFVRAAGTRDNIDIIEEYFLLDINNKKDVPVSISNKITFKKESLKETEVYLRRNPNNFTKKPPKVKESKVKESSRGNPSDYGSVFTLFEKCGFRITGYVSEELPALVDKYSAEWVSEAIKRSADRGKKTLSYVKGILNSWEQAGAMDDGTSNKKQGGNRNGKPAIEPPKYKMFEPDEEKETVAMPDEIRNKLKGMF